MRNLESLIPAVVEKTADPNILGYDSLGRAIAAKDIWFSVHHDKDREGRFSLEPAGSVQSIDKETRGIVLQGPEDVDRYAELIEVELLPRKTWIPIDDFNEKDSQYWRQVQNFLKSEDYMERVDLEPGNKLTYDECFQLALDGSKPTYLYRISESDASIEVQFYDPQDCMGGLKIDRDIGSSMFNFYQGYIATLVDVPQGEGSRKYIVFSKLRLKDELDFVKRVPYERLDSNERMLERLKYDFPWVEEGDLNNIIVQEFVLYGNSGDKLSSLDKKRFRGIYPKDDEMFKQNPNEYEKQYLAIRSYLRLTELATWLEFAETTQDLSSIDAASIVGEKTPQERFTSAATLLANIEGKTRQLLQTRWDKEEELFGEVFPDLYKVLIDRFISQDTLDSLTIAGKYYSGLIGLATRIEAPSFIKELESLSPGERRKKVLAMFAEVTAHENGHLNLKDERMQIEGVEHQKQKKKNEQWPREEIWTQWKSVIYPRRLSGEQQAFDCLYDSNPITGERGGSYEIQVMIDELIELVTEQEVQIKDSWLKTRTIDEQYVLRSALATAFYRREWGSIHYGDGKVLAFADLYDAVAKRQGWRFFEERVVNCSDDDYNSHVSKRKRKSKMSGIRDKQAKIEKKLLQLVTQKVKEQISGEQDLN